MTGEEEIETQDEDGREVPSWVGSVAVAVLALAILGAGAYGLYAMIGDRLETEATSEAVTPSPTSTRGPTATPTKTPTPTLTPTPVPPRAHNVQPGETLSDIAQLYEVAVDDILALNPEVDPELIREGQVLLVPPESAAEGSSSTQGQDDEFLVHVVDSGETLSSIGAEYAVSVGILRAANDLSGDDETIQPGQSLVIPISTPTPGAEAANANSAPTAVPTYGPPPLLNPPDDAVLADDDPVLLQWASLRVLEDNEWYELHLWQPREVFSRTVRTRATAWRMTEDLLEEAADTTGEYHWRVQVVRDVGNRVYEVAGAPSATHTFVWRKTPAETSTVTATP